MAYSLPAKGSTTSAKIQRSQELAAKHQATRAAAGRLGVKVGNRTRPATDILEFERRQIRRRDAGATLNETRARAQEKKLDEYLSTEPGYQAKEEQDVSAQAQWKSLGGKADSSKESATYWRREQIATAMGIPSWQIEQERREFNTTPLMNEAAVIASDNADIAKENKRIETINRGIETFNRFNEGLAAVMKPASVMAGFEAQRAEFNRLATLADVGSGLLSGRLDVQDGKLVERQATVAAAADGRSDTDRGLSNMIKTAIPGIEEKIDPAARLALSFSPMGGFMSAQQQALNALKKQTGLGIPSAQDIAVLQYQDVIDRPATAATYAAVAFALPGVAGGLGWLGRAIGITGRIAKVPGAAFALDTSIKTGAAVIGTVYAQDIAKRVTKGAIPLNLEWKNDRLWQGDLAKLPPVGVMATEARKIVNTEIMPGVVGLMAGIYAWPKGIGYLRTHRATDIDIRGIGYDVDPGFAISQRITGRSLAASFKKGTLIPTPDRMSLTPKVPYVPKMARLPTDAPGDIILWTGWEQTPIPSKLTGRFSLKAGGSSEVEGMYGASTAMSYFTHLERTAAPKLIGMDLPIANLDPAILHTKVSALGTVPAAYSRMAAQHGPVKKAGYRLMNKWLEQNARPGVAYMPMAKSEYESVIPSTGQLGDFKRQFYTKIGGVRVPIIQTRAYSGYSYSRGDPGVINLSSLGLASSAAKLFGSSYVPATKASPSRVSRQSYVGRSFSLPKSGRLSERSYLPRSFSGYSKVSSKDISKTSYTQISKMSYMPPSSGRYRSPSIPSAPRYKPPSVPTIPRYSPGPTYIPPPIPGIGRGTGIRRRRGSRAGWWSIANYIPEW